MKLYARGDWAKRGPYIETTDPKTLVCRGCGAHQRFEDDPDDPSKVIMWESHRLPCPVAQSDKETR